MFLSDLKNVVFRLVNIHLKMSQEFKQAQNISAFLLSYFKGNIKRELVKVTRCRLFKIQRAVFLKLKGQPLINQSNLPHYND